MGIFSIILGLLFVAWMTFYFMAVGWLWCEKSDNGFKNALRQNVGLVIVQIASIIAWLIFIAFLICF